MRKTISGKNLYLKKYLFSWFNPLIFCGLTIIFLSDSPFIQFLLFTLNFIYFIIFASLEPLSFDSDNIYLGKDKYQYSEIKNAHAFSIDNHGIIVFVLRDKKPLAKYRCSASGQVGILQFIKYIIGRKSKVDKYLEFQELLKTKSGISID